MTTEWYALRLAKQAVILSRLQQRLNHEFDVLAEMIKGTPPNITDPPETDPHSYPIDPHTTSHTPI